MAINTVAHYQQVLSMAMEQRSAARHDLVSNTNALFATLKRKGLYKPYSGPRIREKLQYQKQTGQWYDGYDYLDNPPIELFNDAYFTPKMCVVPVSLTMQEILGNEGDNQIDDVMAEYMDAADRALADTIDEALYSSGTANGGKQIGGLGVAVPIVTNTGTYGGISRGDYSIWRTTTYDLHSYDTTIGTQVNATTIRPFLNKIMTAKSRGKDYADLLIMSPEHYSAYDAATSDKQRITKEGGLAKLGFSTLTYVGGGKTAEIVLDGGIGSNMPANTTFGLHTDSFRLRYHPSRNMDKLFSGEGQMPINQDAVAQFLGFMGELTQVNPLFNWRAYDSNTGS